MARELGTCPSCDAQLRGDRVVWMAEPLEHPRTGEMQIACGKCLAISTAYEQRYVLGEPYGAPAKAVLLVPATSVARALELARRGADEGRLLATLDTLRGDPALRSPEVYAVLKPALRGRIELAGNATLRVWVNRVRRLTLRAWDAPSQPPHQGSPYRLGSEEGSIRFFLPAGTELNITGHKIAWAILAPLRLPFTREEARAKRSIQALEAEAALLRPDPGR